MSEEMMDFGEDLAPREFKVRYAGKHYIAREASEAAAVAYRNAQLKAMKMSTVGDDLKVKGTVLPFPRLMKLKAGEAAVFSWIVYRSRAHRDRVNARIMKDPRIQAMMGKGMPFDPKRMSYGGFKIFVDA